MCPCRDPARRPLPVLAILATSRQPLAVAGEQVVPVGPLTTPEPASGVSEVEGSAAGRLFVDRARRVRPGFVVTDANVRAVVDICRQVEGLPLAIELAAARVRAMTPTAIARRLAESYRVLGDGPQAGDPRHRSLEACLRWSFEALSDGEAAVLRRMSVWSAAQLSTPPEPVCAGPDIEPDDVDELLVSLVDKSLVLAEERDGDLRYRLHELVRQFGAARLAGGRRRGRDRCPPPGMVHRAGAPCLARCAQRQRPGIGRPIAPRGRQPRLRRRLRS